MHYLHGTRRSGLNGNTDNSDSSGDEERGLRGLSVTPNADLSVEVTYSTSPSISDIVSNKRSEEATTLEGRNN